MDGKVDGDDGGGGRRVVVLIDMDCFYCQVEEALRPELRGKPIAVVQYNPWRGGGIIAVNYAARACGVTRHMRGDEAKERCPELELCSVPSQRGKADISRYRAAGEAAARVLQRYTPLLERASIDEAYLDITVPVEGRLRAVAPAAADELARDTLAVGYDGWAQFAAEAAAGEAARCGSGGGGGGGGGGGDDDDAQFDAEHARRLVAGAALVAEIRAAVRRDTGYECSAGIAHNKLLAKLVCGLNKPNGQTVLSKHRVHALLEGVAVRRVPQLGGKLGERVCRDLQLATVAELRRVPLARLRRLFEHRTGSWLYNIARGVDMEPVRAKFNPKSIGCCKQFRGGSALGDLGAVLRWLRELAAEVQQRLERETLQSGRRPRQLVASWVAGDSSSSRSYNLTLDDVLDSHFIYSKCHQLVLDGAEIKKPNNENQETRTLQMPITFLGISVGKFEDHSENKNTKNILDFFGAGSKTCYDSKHGVSSNGTRPSASLINNKINHSYQYKEPLACPLNVKSYIDNSNDTVLNCICNNDDHSLHKESKISYRKQCHNASDLYEKASFFQHVVYKTEKLSTGLVELGGEGTRVEGTAPTGVAAGLARVAGTTATGVAGQAQGEGTPVAGTTATEVAGLGRGEGTRVEGTTATGVAGLARAEGTRVEGTAPTGVVAGLARVAGTTATGVAWQARAEGTRVEGTAPTVVAGLERVAWTTASGVAGLARGEGTRVEGKTATGVAGLARVAGTTVTGLAGLARGEGTRVEGTAPTGVAAGLARVAGTTATGLAGLARGEGTRVAGTTATEVAGLARVAGTTATGVAGLARGEGTRVARTTATGVAGLARGEGTPGRVSTPIGSDCSTDLDEEINWSKSLFEDDPDTSRELSPARCSLGTPLESRLFVVSDHCDGVSCDSTATSATVEEYIVCPECSKPIPRQAFSTHSDFHLATRLRDEERRERRRPAAATSAAAAPAATARPITSYFRTVDAFEPLERCRECGRRVAAAALLEHRDFHEAQRLSRELNSAQKSRASGAKRKRLASPPGGPKKKCSSIETFFRQMASDTDTVAPG